MRASICIPYAPRSAWEKGLYKYITERWKADFPEWDIVVGESSQPFNRSAARNNAAAKAHGDVLIFCDADTTYVDPEQIAAAADDCVYGWYQADTQYKLDEQTTNELLLGMTWDTNHFSYERIWPDSPGAIQIMTAHDFHRVGGFDQGFKGWGYEDTSFVKAMNTVCDPSRRHGDTVHLWHPTDRSERQEQPLIGFNKQRYAYYKQAAAKGSSAMLDLLRQLDVLKD